MEGSESRSPIGIALSWVLLPFEKVTNSPKDLGLRA